MKFTKYMNQYKKGSERAAEIRRLATYLKVSPSYIRGILVGLHPFPPRFAIPLYKATSGQVTPNDTCPKFYPAEYNFPNRKAV
jgi:DNA-binding transcriptional regulator YdaS (Cro superfamily)